MITLLIFLLVLSVLVFVHEFGHFITAKKAGIRVDEFGFGFPPRIFGVRKGDTLYSINALPFGGFVKIKGESGEGAEDHDSFANRGAGVRIGIIAAGVIMNVALAAVLIAGGYMIGFPQPIDNGISKYATIKDRRIEIMGVLPGSPAEVAQIKPTDRVISGNGKEFQSAEEFRSFVTEFLEKPIRLTLERDSARREVEVTPKLLEQTNKPGIGVALSDAAIVKYPFWLAMPKAIVLTGVLLKAIVLSIFELIRDAILGRPVTADLAGPVGIAVLTGQAARQGFIFLLQFVSVLSLNLAILNILPFPALDGGRILFIGIEKILRRPVSRKVEGWIHSIGFALLILLVLFVTYKDLGRYGGRIVEFFKGIVQ
ncbi:hypothetical protein A3B21_02045 [Candidatus Uhrbacteria bacterium RIFCSPLOWO2_01_FULL_47_24]|uniref:Peptidase M50 domain-containing protein n=1 Tax=Candidatus Uhrbacteria bacterium RIFCSPLOWO2_01_FULL_47_24 TaxID=1802401 RepID=A0A1F7UPE0_9BACT|nr:MAG: hypothetical protein A2753_01795 [Candidatus Uhrbacteria bacterium RIFCSPHIGHO2_01_FULL_47_11]OGL67950.1 MAG: hypothetical protein A3D58_05240 [Candidatus Uhrbacteria bacterium RIFCSPHIGHO2_02_FULL_46_47]OGL76439.1 MAG: hypothetical protein A3F52_02880 [Candidatus Uhrbacteria bacterium RIFCSPHIGHO2_12_FULL_47_11]OGL80136.1 MAG: hypothetical protein A3B21_02045 [Candidatus Uhrbacteria bacterium RIFCSPLOWO2_01_FULL_47_24]OGL84921.1 MAG: hypothetical protein A3J03_04425 [Candidatus Uhrbact